MIPMLSYYIYLFGFGGSGSLMFLYVILQVIRCAHLIGIVGHSYLV